MINLYNGDCLDVMKQLPAKSVDMILCDLPYGVTACKWDRCLPLNELWECYDHVCKDNAAIVLFANVPFSVKLGYSNFKNLRYEWVWYKNIATNYLNSNKMPLRKHEQILVFYKKQPTYNQQRRFGFKNYKRKGGGVEKSNVYGERIRSDLEIKDGSRCPVDILEFEKESGLHPTQKPVALCEYLIKTYTNEGDKVLDNCMGSGTTGVACLNTKRDFIGIELDENYFKLAKDRIESGKSC